MQKEGYDLAQLKGPSVPTLLLLIAFATELSVHEMLCPFLPTMSRSAGGVLNATLVVLFIAPPLWYLFFRTLPDQASQPHRHRFLGQVLLLKLLIGVFMVEFLAMLALPELLPNVSDGFRNLVDALLVSSVLLCWFAARRQTASPSVLLMYTPLRMYFLLLCTIFLSDLLQEIVLPPTGMAEGWLAPDGVIDALLTTLLGAPLLWFLVVHPLRSAARSEKTRVAAVYAQVIDALVGIDTHGMVTSFNPAAERIFGFSASEMIGTPAALLLEEGQRAVDLLVASVTTGAQPAAPVLREICCRRRDGLTLIMDVSISKLHLERQHPERQHPECLLIMRDITSRKRMEEALRESETRFREIFHQSEDAILFFKPGGCVILDANANSEAIFGHSKAELTDGGMALLCEPDELPRLCRIIASIEEGRPSQYEFQGRRSNGEPMVVSMRGKIMHLQGVPVVYCSFRDITDRVRMEERTRDIQAKLIQTNKMTSLGLLVSGVAHEINNPNNFIMANCELLGRLSRETLVALKEYSEEHGEGGDFRVAGLPFEELERHVPRLIEGITEGSRRVDDIVNKLKAFARQERNQVKRPVDLNHVARSAASLLHHELIKFTEEFHMELAAELPPVLGHGQQLGQVIINLLMNACQALPGKQCGIWLTTGCDPERGEVSISVRDEGCGMTREDSQRILEPFFTTKLDRGGTGLGLSISESIVKEHGGRLEFSSEPGRGTTFTVWLPAVQAAPATGPEAGAPAQHPAGAAEAGPGAGSEKECSGSH